MNRDRFISSPQTQHGISLVELLVGLAIGLIGMLVIIQTMAIWGARTASNISGGDARTSGAIGMYYLERDLGQGGLGFGVTNAPGRQFVPGCAITAAEGNFRLAAIEIAQGVDGAPDTVTVLYGNAGLDSVALFEPDRSTPGRTFSLQGPALQQWNWVVLANLTTCELVRIGSALNTLNNISFDRATTLVRGNLLNLGAGPQRATWRVQQVRQGISVLNRVESIFSAASRDVADGVIDLQAQYNIAGVWQDAAPADWSQLRAIRLAILARSKQFEKPEACNVATPDATPPTWSGGGFVMKNLDASDSVAPTCTDGVVAPDPNDWHQYRYEVFEKIIPLRNVIWGAQS